MNKPIWILLIVLLPVVGALLWFTIGKARGSETVLLAPDDDPAFGRSGGGSALPETTDVDARLRELEEQLKALDEEKYPGEETERDER